MNGVGAPVADLQASRQVEQLVTSIRGLFASMETLKGYARAVVARNLAMVGLKPDVDVDLGTYLEHVGRSRLTPQESFIALLFNLVFSGREAS